MSNNRLKRVAKELQREISQIILYELENSSLGFITITRVEPTPDLKSAKVFMTVLDYKAESSSADEQKSTLNSLTQKAGYIQKLLGKRIRLRYLPKLSFHIDENLEKEQRLLRLISEVNPVRSDTMIDKKTNPDGSEVNLSKRG
jgi:ribosome-binding factor A